MYEDPQVMVDVEKVLPLFKGPCGKKRQGRNEVVEQKLKAGILTITYQCKMAIVSSCNQRNCLFHQVFWQQQHQLQEITLILSAQCMNLSFIAFRHFMSSQALRNYKVK